jgi:voltage-gated potassium channel
VEARKDPLQLPSGRSTPLRTLAVRLAVAVALVLVVALVTWIGRDGYRDLDETPVGILDALYYSTVSITTTGYGDITPVTTGTRLATTLIITPARILFLILLVGTTLEVLAEGSRHAVRQRTWRRRLRGHTIVCGYGTKGRSAIAVLRAKGIPPEQILVIDPRPDNTAEANRADHPAITGDATRGGILEQAHVADAAAVVVAVNRDDTAVLITLIAREHNKGAKISAAVREEENIHLLHQGGADAAILSAGATGRLLGFSTIEPHVVEVLEDLLSVGSGLDIRQRPVTPDDPRRLEEIRSSEPVIAVARGDELLRFDDPRAAELHEGDCLVCLVSNQAD